ncbi:hypothetical protein KQ247_05430 [Ruegeria pomeroyi]|nr:hypothetical protein [Ruegeria pomeroyi]NVK99176.1 hypothetical protein [Ruegeria pomeroyi]NVL01861.1 hypothetical protein [Ruegeria pomeroyi]QWV10043.1 hypothetical protein KQ247_05430 [Ruegeria pomeroyi]HCE71223.1 hypothetical protein [Ruegeria sp.]
MTRVPPFIITALLASMTGAVALAGNESRSIAYSLPGGLIEVVADFSENSIYWCGAGDHALNKMRKPGNQRLYVWKGPSPSIAQPGGRAVTFGFTPPPQGASPALTNDVGIIGNTLSVSQAKKTCDERTSSG